MGQKPSHKRGDFWPLIKHGNTRDSLPPGTEITKKPQTQNMGKQTGIVLAGIHETKKIQGIFFDRIDRILEPF
jgi:hypothetical protein